MSHLKERLTLTDLLTREDVLEGLATKDSLLAHGVRLIHRFGVHGTSIGKLLEAAGKSKSQFYFHFDDKDDFVCRVLELEMTTMLKMKLRFPLEKLEDVETKGSKPIIWIDDPISSLDSNHIFFVWCI